MTNYEIVEIATISGSPWRNGRGHTRQIAGEPSPAGEHSTDFLWRLSQAELERDADFSLFPGMDRVFTLLTPGPVSLTIDDELMTVSQGDTQNFPGEAKVSVALRKGRPEKALNLMLARGHKGEVRVLRFPGSLSLPADFVVAIIVVDGTLTLRDGSTVGPLEAILPPPGKTFLELALENSSALLEEPFQVTVATVQVSPVEGGTTSFSR